MPIPLGILAVAGAGGGAALTPTYTLIESSTGGGANSVTFSSIPSIYSHLEIKIIGRSNRAANTDWLAITFNGDSNNSYTYHQLNGDGGSVSSNGASSLNSSIGIQFTDIRIPANNYLANVFAPYTLRIADYKVTTKNKTLLGYGGLVGTADGFPQSSIKIFSGARINTADITSITLALGGGGSWSSGTRISLYGING